MATPDGQKVTLEGQGAISIWLGGKSKWEDWVSKNPNSDVDFSGVDFGAFRVKHGLDQISFEEYRFPRGGVSFKGAEFGEGNVNFLRTLGNFFSLSLKNFF